MRVIVDHRLPTLLSEPYKKFISSVKLPIFAWSDFNHRRFFFFGGTSIGFLPSLMIMTGNPVSGPDGNDRRRI